jgi:hypothetical protein
MRVFLRFFIDAIALAAAFVCSAYAFGHWGAGLIGVCAVMLYGGWCFFDGEQK